MNINTENNKLIRNIYEKILHATDHPIRFYNFCCSIKLIKPTILHRNGNTQNDVKIARHDSAYVPHNENRFSYLVDACYTGYIKLFSI